METSAAMAFVACENYQKISQKTYVALLCGGNVDVKFWIDINTIIFFFQSERNSLNFL